MREREELDAGIAVEGVADHFMGRPLDENPYCKPNAREAWELWREGWLQASLYRDMREDVERARWQRAA